MNISETFIRRPAATTLIMLSLLVFGAISYETLPVSDLPNVDYPTIVVTANLPGATPETMASSVATPLEKQFSTIQGIDSMASTSTTGSTQITLQFSLSRSLDAAAQDVQANISAALRQLPPELPNPPTYQKVNPADQPVLYLALTSPTLPLSTVDDYGQTMMAQRISTVSGVAQVQVFGSQKYAVRIQVDPMALASRQIGIDDVAVAVADANVNLPTGTLWGPATAYTVNAYGQLHDAAAYDPVIVTYRNGNPVRVRDVGRAIDDVENNKTAAWYIERRGIVLAIFRQPGANTVAVADAVKRLLPTFRKDLPASVYLNTLYDRSESIDASVRDVKFTLLVTLVLVVVVIFVFLRNVRATIIPSLALPMSIVGTFAAMYLFDYTIDNLSLMALTLSVGFVVDDAIVMLENIVRHSEMGKPPVEAALAGSAEIGFTILSMTLSLAAVFIPVLFMGGMIGRLFREFAVTITVAILISGVVSLTLTPMLSSRFLARISGKRHGRLYNLSERGFDAMRDFYGWTLRGALRVGWLLMVIAFVTLVATVYLFVVMPKGFLPNEDRSFAFGFTEAAEGTSYDSMYAHTLAVNRVLESDPYVESFLSTTSRGTAGGTNGFIFMRLIPKEKRKLDADQVIDELRVKLSAVPGLRIYLQNPPPISLGGRLTQSQYQYTLQSGDTALLYRESNALLDRMRTLPGLIDLATDLKIRNPQMNIDIDRDKAATLNITAAQVEQALFDAYGTRQVSLIYASNNTYQVIMEVLPEFQLDTKALSLLYVRSATGNLVPLSAVTKISVGYGPSSVNHSGQLPAVTLSFNLAPNYPLGSAVSEVDAIARGTLPATITTSFEGAAQAFQSSIRGLGILLIMAVLVIYIVLGILYESFLHPLTILSGLPSAGLGAVLTLMLFGYSLDIYAFVGIILLIGLVKKNGIMMIDFAIEARRKEGKSPHDAIYNASIIRFRPIMMTTMSALIAGLTIAIGFGPTGVSRRPLGLAICGGLIVSQMLTLYITPVFYTYMERFAALFGRDEHPKSAASTSP